MIDSDDDDNFQSYGTLLEPYEEDEIPKKKAFSIEDQIATDDQGRRRFHGAFTGGFSAGFFNTVGSLEGWKPTEFKSSRSEKAEKKLQKPQDFMDDEDIGKFGIAPSVVRATSDYSNQIRSNKRALKSEGPIPGIPVLESFLQPAKDTVGIRLLKKMGWKPGQGVGPRLTKKEKRRINRENAQNEGKIYGCEIPESFRKQIHPESASSSDEDSEITFAPDDYEFFIYKPKDNSFGMGYSGLNKAPVLSTHINLFEPPEFKMRDHKNQKISISGQAFGVGAFEIEDEDIYARDDMSKYDFELESSLKKNTKKSKQAEKPKGNIIEGFVLAKNLKFVSKKLFPLPNLSKNFIPKHGARISRFEPLPESHKLYNYDRNKTIGRHDLTSTQRSKILSVISSEPKDTEIKKQALKITSSLPTENIGPFKPFLINPDKQKRYEEYLTLKKIGSEDKFSEVQPASMSDWEKEREKFEFDQAARMFKPVSGLVFDKFVAASSSDDNTDQLRDVGKSVYEHGTQEMREAAKKKLFGPLTRIIEVWKPNKLLCKRFNVPEPDISETEMVLARKKKKQFSVFDYYEAYQQNKTIKDGPEPKKPEEKSIEFSSETLVEVSNNQEEKSTSTNLLNNIVIEPQKVEEDKPEVIEEKSQSLNLEEQQLNKEKEIPKVAPLPTDPKEKKDLFKAIFLSSSEESEEEKEEPIKEQKITEMKKILLEEEPEKKNKGIFADLDWDKINKNKQATPLPEEKVEENKDEKKEEHLFGPKLPTDIPKNDWKPTFSKKVVNEKDVSSSEEEWMELDYSSSEKSRKKISKKLKKHKSERVKHKKHKSKHKKKKH